MALVENGEGRPVCVSGGAVFIARIEASAQGLAARGQTTPTEKEEKRQGSNVNGVTRLKAGVGKRNEGWQR